MDEQRELIAGTGSADFFVIDMKNKSLKGAVGIGNLGVTSVITIDASTLAVGCGSGELAIYKKVGNRWELGWSTQLGHLISSLSYNSNGKLIATTNHSQSILVDIQNRKTFLLREGHNGGISHIKFADSGGKMFASASADGSIRFWDMKSFLVVGNISVAKSGSPLCMSITDDIMISGWEDGSLRMHEVESTKCIWELDSVHKNGVTSIDLTKDSKHIATGGADGVVRLWELRSLSMKTNLKEHTNKITKVKLWPGDNNLISSSRDKSLLHWDLVKEKRLQAFYQTMGGVNSFDIIPDKNLIISTGQDRKVSYWDLRQPNVVKCFDTDSDAKNLEECMKIRCTRDGKTFYTGGAYIKAWDVGTGKLLSKYIGHSNGVMSLDLSYDEKNLLTGGNDGSILVWKIN